MFISGEGQSARQQSQKICGKCFLSLQQPKVKNKILKFVKLPIVLYNLNPAVSILKLKYSQINIYGARKL